MASQDTGLPKVHAKMLATKSGIHLVGNHGSVMITGEDRPPSAVCVQKFDYS